MPANLTMVYSIYSMPMVNTQELCYLLGVEFYDAGRRRLPTPCKLLDLEKVELAISRQHD